MLGRLFKQNSPQTQSNGYGPSSATSNNQSSSPYGIGLGATKTSSPGASGISNNLNSYEDSYTREILYGTSAASQLQPSLFNNKFFRIVVSQDGGSLRTKQVLFDSSMLENSQGKTAGASQGPSSSASRNIMTSKLHHNINEINDYMFGCGLPTNEHHCTTKLHILPALNNQVYGTNRSILITRLFLISDNNDSMSFGDASTDEYWHPHSSLPIRQVPFKYGGKSGNQNDSPYKDMYYSDTKTNNINSRFSIGLIIPLENGDQDITETILTNWNEISYFMIVLQRLIVKTLISVLHRNASSLINESTSPYNRIDQGHSPTSGSPFIINKRIQFPNYVLQNNPEIHSQLIKLIKLIHYDTNIPKLINSNSLMKWSLQNRESELSAFYINWVFELLNWLEYKDGKAMLLGSGNIANCPAKSNQNFSVYNNNFENSESHLSNASNSGSFSPSGFSRDFNGSKSFLASLFSVLIPLRHSLAKRPLYYEEGNKAHKEVTRVVIMTGNPVVAKKLLFIINGLIPDEKFYSSVDISLDALGALTGSEEVKSEDTGESDKGAENPYSPNLGLKFASQGNSSDNIPSTSEPTGIKPIPIKRTSLANDNSFENSLSKSAASNKGWEIASKSTASTSTAPYQSRIESNTTAIPITQKAQAQRSSLSKSQSMAYLSSSLNSSLSSSTSNYSLSKLGGTFIDKWKNSFGANQYQNYHTSNSMTNPDNMEHHHSNGFNMMNLLYSLRTPSPALEGDEYLWNSDLANTVLASGSPLNNHRITRTTSMQEISSSTNFMHNKRGNVADFEHPKLTGPGVKRTKSGVYFPISLKSEKVDRMVFNSSIIKRKCNAIMNVAPKFTSDDMKTLLVNPKNFNEGAEDSGTTSLDFDSPEKPSQHRIAPLIQRHTLQPVIGFTDEFRPEFTLQSCLINPKLESQVMNAMKNDLIFYHNNCEYVNVTSRTVFVSLRAREIKMIELSTGDRNHFNSLSAPSNADELHSPYDSNSETTSSNGMSRDNVQLKSPIGITPKRTNYTLHLNYRTTIKKIFTQTRNACDVDKVNQIEKTFEELNKIFQSHTTSDIEKLGMGNNELYGKLRRLLNSMLN